MQGSSGGKETLAELRVYSGCGLKYQDVPVDFLSFSF